MWRLGISSLLLLALSTACGSEAVEEQLHRHVVQLTDGSPEERAAAAESLGAMGAEAASVADVLVRELGKDAIDQALLDAVETALVEIGAPALPALSTALRGGYPVERDRALEVVRRMGPAGARAVPDLLFLIRGSDERVRDPARQIVLNLGDAAVPHLLAALNAEDWLERAPAVKCLMALGPSATGMVRPLLDDPFGRGGALDFLLLCETIEGLSPEHLDSSLADAGVENRVKAMKVLTKLECDWEQKLTRLRRALRDAEVDVLLTAIRALVDQKHESAPAALELATLLEHDEAEVRSAAAKAVHQVVSKPSPEVLKSILHALIAAVDDERTHVRVDAHLSLSKLAAGREDCLDLMIAGLSDPSFEVRIACARALQTYGERAAPAARTLAEAIGCQESDAGWRNDAYQLRGAALNTLRAMGPAAKPAVPVLIGLLTDERDQVFNLTVYALLNLKAEAGDALPALKKIAESNPDEKRRKMAAKAIEAIVAGD